MKFVDEQVQRLDLNSVDDFARLICEYLCGDRCCQPLEDSETRGLSSLISAKTRGKPQADRRLGQFASLLHQNRIGKVQLRKDDRAMLSRVLASAKSRGLNYQQMNELLLLLNQDLMGPHFFKFFFEREGEKDSIKLEELTHGVMRFRGFAMLCFGNFRFAYKRLAQKTTEEIRKELNPYQKKSDGPDGLETAFRNRPKPMLGVRRIEKEKTCYLGEVTGKQVNRQLEALEKELESSRTAKGRFSREELAEAWWTIGPIADELRRRTVERKGLSNTDTYLTWDYLDVYIATSMRHSWEYEETFDFIRKVFGHPKLTRLRLRYFDPTQSKCNNPRDKGLTEGLMLKRALCTIYLAQESETMGKDSELAATLAQSKPVIAYVPKHEPTGFADKIKDYPLEFFKKRWLSLQADGVFDERKCMEDIKRRYRNPMAKMRRFQKEFDAYRKKQPYSLWKTKDDDFKKNCHDFAAVCGIIAGAECFNYEQRAGLLRERHPLGMQVDLRTGVANGVLVARSTRDCVELLRRVLLNELEFRIEHQEKEGLIVLKESTSSSPFRVVTDYERLTNSFWNLWRLIDRTD